MNGVLSILLIVRDWSTQRLELSLASLLQARSGLKSEIVLLDYGSQDPEPYQDLAQTYKARYIRAQAEVWSRSRAVNIAAGEATGEWLLFADADMLWSPESLTRSVELVEQDANQFLVFQARDLPESRNGETLTTHGYSWDDLEAVSGWRPRWGMGMQMVRAKHFRQVQGLDERMTVWGAEDADMARRLRSIGLKQHWVNHPEVRVYHVWHSDSKRAANLSSSGADALKRNRDILYRDPTVLRNIPHWSNRPIAKEPLVSVVIVTRDRHSYLQESIESVLGQTVTDFEIVVVDDGTEGGVAELVAAYKDERLRYFKTPRTGVAAGRNFGAEVSRGHYTAVHDDDDIMLPWSLQVRLNSIHPGDVGSYGGFWNFADETGELELVPGKEWSLQAVYSGKTVGHPTMLLETDVVRRVGYDESIQAGSDYKFRVQVALAGYNLRHCGDVVTLRRVHTYNMSVVDLSVQRSTSDLVNAVLRFNTTSAERESLRSTTRDKSVPVYDIPPHLASEHRVRPWLPDHLVMRVGIIRHDEATVDSLELESDGRELEFAVSTPESIVKYTLLSGIKPSTVSALRARFGTDNQFVVRAFRKRPWRHYDVLPSLVVCLLSAHEQNLNFEEAATLYTIEGDEIKGVLATEHRLADIRRLLRESPVLENVVLSPSLENASLASLMTESKV